MSEISSSSALVSWGHPDVTVDQLSIAPDQLSYELSMAESRPGSGSSSAAPPPPAAAFRRVCSDRTVSTELSKLRPATTYYLTYVHGHHLLSDVRNTATTYCLTYVTQPSHTV